MNMSKIIFPLLAIFFLIGLSTSTCPPPGGCTKTASSSVVEGTTITLSGPADSGSQDRPIDWVWSLWKCNAAGANTDVTNTYKISPTTDTQSFSFYAPPEGSYYVSLTTKDKTFPNTCYTVSTLCFTTTKGDCPPLCCGYVCEDDTYDPASTACPWYMSYTGLTANYVFEWTVDGYPYKRGTGDSAKSVSINWVAPTFTDAGGVTRNLGLGAHTVGFNIYEPPYEAGKTPLRSCSGSSDPTLCSCPANEVPGLSQCQVYVVDKPEATITGTGISIPT